MAAHAIDRRTFVAYAAATLGIVGPGTTTSAVLDQLGVPSTLLGIDVILGSEVLQGDASESDVLKLLDRQP